MRQLHVSDLTLQFLQKKKKKKKKIFHGARAVRQLQLSNRQRQNRSVQSSACGDAEQFST